MQKKVDMPLHIHFFIVKFPISLFHFPTESFGYCWKYNLTVHDVQAFLQAWIGFAGFFPTHIGQAEGLWESGIGQGEGGSVWYGSRNVRHAIVDDTVYLIGRFGMGGRV